MSRNDLEVLVVLLPKLLAKSRIFLVGSKLAELTRDRVFVVAAFDRYRRFVLDEVGGAPVARARTGRYGGTDAAARRFVLLVAALSRSETLDADALAADTGSFRKHLIGSGAGARAGEHFLFRTEDRIEILERAVERILATGTGRCLAAVAENAFLDACAVALIAAGNAVLTARRGDAGVASGSIAFFLTAGASKLVRAAGSTGFLIAAGAGKLILTAGSTGLLITTGARLFVLPSSAREFFLATSAGLITLTAGTDLILLSARPRVLPLGAVAALSIRTAGPGLPAVCRIAVIRTALRVRTRFTARSLRTRR